MKGIYLFNTDIDFDQFFYDCQEFSINWVFTHPLNLKKKDFQEKSNDANIKKALIFPVFFDKEYLESNPKDYSITNFGRKAFHDWSHFACPTSSMYFEKKKNELKELLFEIRPDMIAFDFIRFFVFWEKIYPDISFDQIEDGCYCSRCLDLFSSFSKLGKHNLNPQWIKKNAIEQWAEWKCMIIENVVKELVLVTRNYDKNIPIMIKTIPWKVEMFNQGIKSITGQDIVKLKDYVDIISPMTYSFMIKQPASYIHDITKEIFLSTKKPTIPCIQIEKCYRNEDINHEEFNTMIINGLKSPSDGIILFHYDTLKSNMKKAELLKSINSIL